MELNLTRSYKSLLEQVDQTLRKKAVDFGLLQFVTLTLFILQKENNHMN